MLRWSRAGRRKLPRSTVGGLVRPSTTRSSQSWADVKRSTCREEERRLEKTQAEELCLDTPHRHWCWRDALAEWQHAEEQPERPLNTRREDTEATPSLVVARGLGVCLCWRRMPGGGCTQC